ncbi:hypothetical protein KY348_02195 [Candidatus Woesearchaeota archaeon]|nr:hypothetical protein [Candidatus Woesearchaeota archaeon]
MKKGQGAFEYVLVVAIAMVLIVPGAMLFYNYSVRSSDELTRSQINMLGNEIMDGVEKVYYIGENTWVTLETTVPDNVRNIYVLNNYELVIEYNSHSGLSEAVFFSEINMTTPNGGNISDSPHPGLNIIRIVSMGDFVFINETR